MAAMTRRAKAEGTLLPMRTPKREGRRIGIAESNTTPAASHASVISIDRWRVVTV
ncbi:MAG: hypothetical protein M3R15_17840 [Acidobacteriota bacterium]|nr:hypothetical protein [Acidobacteriota bacterium]